MEHLIELRDVYKIYPMGSEQVHALEMCIRDSPHADDNAQHGQKGPHFAGPQGFESQLEGCLLYTSNHSSGRMGYAIAREAMLRGAQVTLISGRTALPPVPFVALRPVTTAADMLLSLIHICFDCQLLSERGCPTLLLRRICKSPEPGGFISAMWSRRRCSGM